MDKLKPIFILIIPLVFSIASGCKIEKAETVMAKHQAKYPDIRKKYIYQSVLRLANVKGDPDINKLIKDVRKIIVYLPPREDSTYQIKELSNSIASDGFEQLVDVRNEDSGHISLWVKESNSSSKYIGFSDIEDTDIIFEIDGQLNLKYISALKFVNQEVLMDLLK